MLKAKVDKKVELMTEPLNSVLFIVWSLDLLPFVNVSCL